LTVPECGCFGVDVVHGHDQNGVGVEAAPSWFAAHGDVSHLVDAVSYQGEGLLCSVVSARSGEWKVGEAFTTRTPPARVSVE